MLWTGIGEFSFQFDFSFYFQFLFFILSPSHFSCCSPTSAAETGGRFSQAGHSLRQAEEAGAVPRHLAGTPHHPPAHLAVRLSILHAGIGGSLLPPFNG